MKIFCETHGQPLALSPERGEWTCKFTGCLVAISAATVNTLAEGMRSVKVTEIWLASK
jgi:hypothetical protein